MRSLQSSWLYLPNRTSRALDIAVMTASLDIAVTTASLDIAVTTAL